MPGQIFSIQSDEALVELAERPFATEDLFRSYWPNIRIFSPGIRLTQLIPENGFSSNARWECQARKGVPTGGPWITFSWIRMPFRHSLK